MPRIAKVTPRQLPNGTWHIDTMATGKRYRMTWPTEHEAIRDAERIKREIAGVGLNAADLREYDAAAHRLATTDLPGRGHSITFVVDWFLSNFVGSRSNRTLKEWAEDYVAEKKEAKLRAKSLREIRQYLTDHFIAAFGHLTPLQISTSQLKEYLAANTSRWHRDKVLRAFFSWLAGEECRKMITLTAPPLKQSPFAGIRKQEYERASDEIVFLSVTELRAAIELAIREYPEALGQLVFLAFTGLRPDCEAPPFWKSDKHGWRRIDFTRRLLTVTKELEKTKKRSRQLVLQPNVGAWLEYFQRMGTPMVCPRRAWRNFKNAAYPAKRKVQDLLRHTALSNYAKRLPLFELERQFATSDDILLDHYLVQIADEAEVDEYFSFTPASFGLT